LNNDVLVIESLDKLSEDVTEFESMASVALISPGELPATSSVIVGMSCKGLEEFVSLELDCTMVAELMSLLFEAFPANELLVNKANVSGVVKPGIESDEASNSERTLLATF